MKSPIIFKKDLNKPVTSEEIEEATKKFLEKGGEIKKIENLFEGDVPEIKGPVHIPSFIPEDDPFETK